MNRIDFSSFGPNSVHSEVCRGISSGSRLPGPKWAKPGCAALRVRLSVGVGLLVAKPYSPSPLILLTPPNVLSQPRKKLFRLDVEGFADAQHGEERRGPSRLDHLPVTHAESVGNHVLLAQHPFSAVRANAMAEGTEEAFVACRKLPGCAHQFKLNRSRAKSPRAKMRVDLRWPQTAWHA